MKLPELVGHEWKNRLRRLRVAGAALLIFGLIGLVSACDVRAFSSYDNTVRALNAITGTMVDCTAGVQSASGYRYDALAIPGGEDAIRLRAAEVVFREGYVPQTGGPRIFILEGAGSAGVNGMTDESYLLDLAREAGHPIDPKLVVVDDQSINTWTSAKVLADDIAGNPEIKKVGVVDGMIHVRRTILSMCLNGVAAEGIIAEPIVVEHYLDQKNAVGEALTSLDANISQKKELVENLSVIWFPGGTDFLRENHADFSFDGHFPSLH